MSNTLVKFRSNKYRLVVYPLALVAVAILGFIGWIQEPEPDMGARLSSADMLARSGAYDEAQVHLDFVFDSEPNSRHAWLIQGLIDERQGRETSAIKSYRAALVLTSESDLKRDIKLSVADLFRRLENFQASKDELGTIEDELGEIPGTLRMRGLIAWQEAQFDQARSYFAAAKRLDPENAEFDAMMAGTLIEEQRYGDAWAALNRIPAEESVAWPYWHTLARSYMEVGDAQGAERALRKYVQLDKRGRGLLKNNAFWHEHAQDVQIEELLNG